MYSKYLIAVTVIVLVDLLSRCQYINCSVSWFMATTPAIFGKDVVLTCYTGHPLLNSKDCPVRQWSGGPDRKGLTYNGYSSDDEKYEELENLLTNQFSLKIKNFSESDVLVNYTCSCGFNTSNQKLVLIEEKFFHNPTAINVTFVTTDDVLQVHFKFRNVYPVPNCSLSTGNHTVSSELIPTINSAGLFYNVMYEGEFKLTKDDCEEVPILKCEFCKPNCQKIKPIVVSGDKHHCLDYKEQSTISDALAVFQLSTETEYSTTPVNSENTDDVGVIALAVLMFVIILVSIVVDQTEDGAQNQ